MTTSLRKEFNLNVKPSFDSSRQHDISMPNYASNVKICGIKRNKVAQRNGRERQLLAMLNKNISMTSVVFL